jgi:hypothetical protein
MSYEIATGEIVQQATQARDDPHAAEPLPARRRLSEVRRRGD